MTARPLFRPVIEAVCDCGARFVVETEWDELNVHLAENRSHVIHPEIDGVPVDRKPRVR